METIYTFMTWFNEFGGTRYFLPFLIIFSLVFGLLDKMNIFATGEGKNRKPLKSVNAIISLAIAFIAVTYTDLGLFFAKYFANISMWGAVFLAFLLVMGLFARKGVSMKGPIFGLAAVIVIIAVGISLYNAAWAKYFSITRGDLYMILLVIVFLAIISFVMGEDSESTTKNSLWKSLKAWDEKEE